MTPFGLKIRELRDRKGVTQKQMAKEIGVSPAYLSALERGHRGQPSWQFVQRIIGYFNIIWDEADTMQQLAVTSNTRVVVDTESLSAEATSLANYIAEKISRLTDDDCKALKDEISKRAEKPTG